MVKTSLSHPLRIDSVQPLNALGKIGMTFCPGKIQPNSMSGGDWYRDLITDLNAIAGWNTAMLICLLEDHEIDELRVPAFGTPNPDERFTYYRLPIVDGGIPDAIREQSWGKVNPYIHLLLKEGRNIVIFCKGGLGRTGTIAARILIEFGELPQMAIQRVRVARLGAVETKEQEQYLLRLKQHPGNEC